MRRHVSRHAVTEWLKQRFFLRVHMFWILIGTFLAGLLATKVLLEMEVHRLWLRWSISVLVAYLVFLFLIRLWLWYVRFASRPSFDGPGDEIEPIADLFAQLHGHTIGAVDKTGAHFDAGEFGGGGATGSWGDIAVDDAGGSSASAPSLSDAGGCLDVDEGVVVVVLIVALFALLFAGFYVIWVAPAILAEAAFEAALAAALARSARRIDRPGWVGKVWQSTIIPLAVVLFFAAIAGWMAQDHCPDAKRLRDVIACLLAD